jgi:hypothetical protein
MKCVECGREQTADEHGWKCAEREFGVNLLEAGD